MHPQDISQTITAQQAALTEAIVALQYRRQPELRNRYGDIGRAKSVRDTAYHLAYLAEALAVERAALFAHYLSWATPMLASYNVPPDILAVTLDCIRETLLAQLPSAAHATVAAYLDAGAEAMAVTAPTVPSFLHPDAPLSDLAAVYLDLLLRGDRRAASERIQAAVAEGVPVRDIYLHVFQPAQYEIGRLWQTNQISVAQEHYATAVTQLVMSQLYNYIFATERRGHSLVATCVGGELHEIGVRMVADFFEMAGWDTFYLGANMPLPSVIRTLQERQADVLAVSATIGMHTSEVTRLIAAVRAAGISDTRIMVGGYPFNLVDDLWQQVGADGYAPHADAAIALAEQWAAG